MNYGEIYNNTWWGNPEENGWGSVYHPYQDE